MPGCFRELFAPEPEVSQRDAELAQTKAELEETKTKLQTVQKDLHGFMVAYRKLNDEVQNLKGNIRVFCRVRPCLPDELGKPLCIIRFCKRNTIELSTAKGKSKGKYTFDRVFANTASQEAVFEELSQLVQSAIDGHNICVFAYGPTGSGKTYTMEGGTSRESMGIIPRAINMLFQSFPALENIGWIYSVQASCLEIYNENIVDLLGNTNKLQHEIRMDQLKTFIKSAQKKRSVDATTRNEKSSRSHFVVRIRLEAVNEESNNRSTSSITLVDLAGSERMDVECVE